MPWLSILLALISYFSSSRSTPSQKKQALLTAGLVGAGTYAVSNYTTWGQANLGSLNGYVAPTVPTLVGAPVVNADGSSTQAMSDGTLVTTMPNGSSVTTTGPVGTAVTNGTATATSSGLSSGLNSLLSSPVTTGLLGAAAGAAIGGGSSLLPLLLVGVGAFLLLR